MTCYKTIASLLVAVFITIPGLSLPAFGGNAWLDTNGIYSDSAHVSLNGASVSNLTYWMDPPFLSTKVAPNVLIVLDNSGSMREDAYRTGFNPAQFVNNHYFGYFDPAKCYQYSSSQWNILGNVDVLSDCSAFSGSATTASPVANGDFLNWAYMLKIEVAKKLLIGGKTGARTVIAPAHVMLNGETNESSTAKDYNNSSNPANEKKIYPFNSNYRFLRTNNQLNITPLATSESTYPTGNILAPAAWVATGAPSAWQAVGETAADGDATRISNTTTNGTASAVVFGYNYTGATTGTIASVTVRVRAKRSSSSTMRISGVLRISGTNYVGPTTYTSLASTSYQDYSFTFNSNPATASPWQWSEINAALEGFGLQNYTLPTGTNYPTVTQVYMIIARNEPASGPFTLTVDTGTSDISDQGIIPQLSNEARFGLAHYNTDNGGRIQNYIDFGMPASMITSINNLVPSTWTPLAETLHEMVRYFQQSACYYFGTDYTVAATNDPYYYKYSTLPSSGIADQYVPCAKSFVLMMTDGESTQDQNIPVFLRDYNADGNDPIPDNIRYPSNGSDFLDDVAFYARTVDQRAGLAGNQNIVTYPVFMFGRGSDLLQRTSIWGGFDDVDNNNFPSCIDPATRQLKAGVTQGELKECYRDSNGNSTLDPYDPVWNPNGDMPLTYFEGDDGYQLQANIIDAISKMLQRASSGTSVSVLGSSWKGEGAVYQAYFYPEKTEDLRRIKWTGYFRAMFVDRMGLIHEDSDSDGRLIPDNDKVTKFVFTPGLETQVEYYMDRINNSTSNPKPDGLNDTPAPIEPPVGMTDVKPLWDAGKLLAQRAASDRTIYTSVDNANLVAFDPSNGGTVTSLRPYLRGKTDADAQKLMRFIRGEVVAGWRDRQLTVAGTLQTWKLGDIVFSDPVVVGAPKERFDLFPGSKSYVDFYKKWKNRRSVVYVGSNDGMLHAFNGGFPIPAASDPNLMANQPQVTFCTALTFDVNGNVTGCAADAANPLGKELWAYIPYDLLPHLAWLADPDYQHTYFVDQMVRLTDARVFTPDADHVNGWGTIMIVGLRFGGGEIDVTDDFGSGSETKQFKSAYYCLDITNPDSPKMMWRFTDNELGFTTTVPTIVREDIDNDTENSNETWYAVFGSGPSNFRGGRVVSNNNAYSKFTRSGQVAGIAGMNTTAPYLFVVNLKTGGLQDAQGNNFTIHSTVSGDLNRPGVMKLSSFENNAFAATPTGVDYFPDMKWDMLYAGTTFCSAGCNSEGVGTWSGSMRRIAPNKNTDPGRWTVSRLFLTPAGQPITSKPSAALDGAGNVWVYFGTGRYLHIDDRFDLSAQSFYGMKDPCYFTGCTTDVALGDLLNSTNIDVLTNGNLYPSPVSYNAQNFTEFTSLDTYMQDSGKGWRLNGSAGERITTNGFVVGGIAGFGSYTPSSNVCEFEGTSTEYFPYFTTGTAYNFGTGSGAPTYASGGGTAYSRSVFSGQGLPSAPAIHIDSMGKVQIVIQMSTGAITTINMSTGSTTLGGYGSGSESVE